MNLVFTRFIFWPWFTGLTFLLIGIWAVRGEMRAVHGLDKLIVLGRPFFASPLAAFGAEHLAGAQFIMQVVPAWMPGRLFWTYFVGVALLAAATGIVLSRYVRLTATLLTVMFALFVLLIHLPNAAAKPADRIIWAVVLRDSAFAGGALALAAAQTKAWGGWPMVVARLSMGIPVAFFAVEHFLHPEFAPGVPLAKVTPAWIPLGPFWGYPAGAILLATAVALLLNKHSRAAATWIGLLMTLLVLFLYLPILARDPAPELIEGVNYVFDTLLFGGAALLLAAAMPRQPL